MSYVTDTLVPALHPGDTIVIDNLAAHKVAGVRQAIEAAGAHLRSLPDLGAAIREAFTRFKAEECRNDLTAAGYDVYDPA